MVDQSRILRELRKQRARKISKRTSGIRNVTKTRATVFITLDGMDKGLLGLNRPLSRSTPKRRLTNISMGGRNNNE